jgi:general secretion pathway protein K
MNDPIHPRRNPSSSDGVAMVIVLWVIMVLSLLISGFAFTMYVETQVASFSRKELKAEQLARSGVEVARMQLLLHMKAGTEAGYEALNQEWVTNTVLYVDHELGEGKYTVKVIDEESKLPINLVTQDQLRRVMDLLGVEPSDGDVIVDSILDWREPGELHRLNGAKSDYYQSLSPPYVVKGAPFDRIEELLLVRGVTRDLFYGTDTNAEQTTTLGLKDFFSASPAGKLNVNTATNVVLQALLGVEDDQVAALLNRRDGIDGIPGTDDDRPFNSTDEFVAELHGSVNPQILATVQPLLTVRSSYFNVKSTGEVGGVKRTIIAILQRQDPYVTTVSWNEVRGGL